LISSNRNGAVFLVAFAYVVFTLARAFLRWHNRRRVSRASPFVFSGIPSHWRNWI